MKIANAKYLTVKIGRYNGTVSPEVRDTVLKLIEVTS
jgi:hypothetical protein